MECLEAKALKSSHWESAMESPAQQEVSEEFVCLNTPNLEDFEVDEFFNFSNADLDHNSAFQAEDDDEEEEEEFKKYNNLNQYGGFPTVNYSESLISGELVIPGDAVAELEWVSHFVDDSCSEFSFPLPIVKAEVQTGTFAENRYEPETRVLGTGISCFLSTFPVRPRTKRSRQSRERKSPGSSPTRSSSSSTTSSEISSTDGCENVDWFNTPSEPQKKQRKIAVQVGGSAGSTVQFQRRCSHCLVQKTPQWRTGPNGAKTLCNACGVRYKSGRLFPEYRPALSPTFCSDVHSNSHRKVLEMRKVKEHQEPVSGLTRMVPSY